MFCNAWDGLIQGRVVPSQIPRVPLIHENGGSTGLNEKTGF